MFLAHCKIDCIHLKMLLVNLASRDAFPPQVNPVRPTCRYLHVRRYIQAWKTRRLFTPFAQTPTSIAAELKRSFPRRFTSASPDPRPLITFLLTRTLHALSHPLLSHLLWTRPTPIPLISHSTPKPWRLPPPPSAPPSQTSCTSPTP